MNGLSQKQFERGQRIEKAIMFGLIAAWILSLASIYVYHLIKN